MPLGDFKPADQWQTHVNAIFYGIQGPGIHNHFQTFVSRDHRLAHALADSFLRSAETLPKEGPLAIAEWGIGNGNLAGSFLTHLREQDNEGRVYPRLVYHLCDYSDEILNGAKAHPRLADHVDRTRFIKADAENFEGLEPGSLHKIVSNEIWDDLATRVLLKHDGLLYEEFLQPLIDPSVAGHSSFEELVDAFNRRDLETLANIPAFLDSILWERSFQRVELSDWPWPEVITHHLVNVQDEIPTPINTGAFRALEKAWQLLANPSLGYTGFDYGMLTLEELNSQGRPYFRVYGGQYTNMVNFPLLEDVGRAIGFTDIEREAQSTFVANQTGEPVVSAVDLVQMHPNIRRMQPWEVDQLMIRTLAALNRAYKSPYRQKLDYPPVPGTPKKQRKQLVELVRNLSASGVPDTVAYLTRGEVNESADPLRKLGYRQQDMDGAFNAAPPPVSFAHLTFKR